MAERGQILTISQAHSGTMGQDSGEIWTAETRLQPILPKSDRLLDKPASFFRRRHAAGVRLAHPLIAMPGDKTVDQIPKRPGNDDEGIQPGPPSMKVAKNFERCSGFGEDFSVF